MSGPVDRYTIEPRELARHEGRWDGRVPLRGFERLAEAVDAGHEFVEVQLALSLDADDRCRCVGQASFEAGFECHRCLEAIRRVVTVELDAVVVNTEEEAARLMPDYDVVVVGRGKVPVSQLLEDDLIMALPNDVCVDGPKCANAPTTQYPEGEDDAVDSPFAALATLKSEQSKR